MMRHNDVAAAALARRLQGECGEPIALFLDVDGTLADLAPTPREARLAPELLPALAVLRDRLCGALAVISGRPVADLDRMLAPLAFDLAGLHGADIRIGGRAVTHSHPTQGLRRALRHVREQVMLRAPGLLIEDKGAAFALHWRLAPLFAAQAAALMAKALAIAGVGYRMQRGDCVAEIVPAAADKGQALRLMMAQPPFAGRMPVHCGDDLTDEAAFAACQDLGGTGVKIGLGPSLATLRLESPAQLRSLILAPGLPLSSGLPSR
jgi:trehalose 6-phosphate phosphatase